MAEEYFKVRKGLAVGEDFTIDADTAGLTTTGTLEAATVKLTNNDILASDGTTAITLSGADVEVEGDLTVTGNDIKSSTGATAITLDGDDVILADNLDVTGEVSTDERFRYGSIRNATADAAGAVARLLNANFYGESISDSLVSGNRTGLVFRNERSTPAQGLLFEVSKAGSALTTGTTMGLQFYGGYNGTNWQFDTVSGGSVYTSAIATENWTSTACGGAYQLNIMPIGYNSIGSLQINNFSPADTYLSTKQLRLIDLSAGGGGTGTQYFTVKEDDGYSGRRELQIQNGINNITCSVGDINGAGFTNRITNINILQADTVGGDAAQINFQTARYDLGTSQYTPTQDNDRLGEFFFNGNYTTGATPLVNSPAARFGAYATETWTSTANGGGFYIESLAQGTNSGGVRTFEIEPAAATVKSNEFILEDSTGTALKGNKIDYRRTFGCFHKNANVTAAAADTVYDFDWATDGSAHVNTQGITLANNSEITFDTAGAYNIAVEMQVKNTDNAERLAWVWLAKNGTDIAGTSVKIGIRPKGSADQTYYTFYKEWLVEDITANDYIELRFAVDNTSGISLEYNAAITSPYNRPASPSAVLTITPVGA